jgi:hypothetical protein
MCIQITYGDSFNLFEIYVSLATFEILCLLSTSRVATINREYKFN